jgi:hypothetical protein
MKSKMLDMKQIIRTYGFKAFMTLMMVNLMSLVVMAQDSGGGTTTTTTATKSTSSETVWYTSPWVWVAGAAVFILLLVALLRGSSDKTGAGRTDRVTVTKTTRSETD